MTDTLRFALSRLATTAMIVFGAMLLLFALQAIVPGDPASALLGPQATPELRQQFIRDMGLDQPLPIRLWRYFATLLSGDLGRDVVSGRPVATLVREVLPYTLILTFASLALSAAVGAPLGIYAATHRGSLADTALAFLSVAFIAMPSFVVAILLLLVFAIQLDWLPVLGASRTGGLVDEAKRLVLPTVAIAIGWTGYFARLMRSSMLETLAEPHIRTMRAYGLSERLVTYKYALKNAAIPAIALLGFGIGRVLGNAVFIEVVFARPGIGRLIYEAISQRNYPVVQGAVLAMVALVAVVNLAVDLVFSWLDPRMRREPAGGAA